MSQNLIEVTLTLNGKNVTARVAPDTTLYTFVRERGCASVKCACETTNCGLCTVWLDGSAVLSCAIPMARVNGREVTTLEGLQEESAAFARCMAEEGGRAVRLLLARPHHERACHGARDSRARGWAGRGAYGAHG